MTPNDQPDSRGAAVFLLVIAALFAAAIAYGLMTR